MKTRRGILLTIFVLALGIFVLGVVERVALTKNKGLAAIYSSVLVSLANENRDQQGLKELTVNPLLQQAAQMKADDMAAKGYFSHYGPDGSKPWDWMKKAGYNYMYAGENLAIDFVDSNDVDTAWMNSTLHRQNILNGNFTEIGVATAEGNYQGHKTVYVVQMFGKPQEPNVFQVLFGTASSTPALVWESVITNPHQTAFALYFLLILIVLALFVYELAVEYRAKDKRHAVYSLLLLLALIMLMSAYNYLIVPHVMIM
jgi:hypothetical protein